MDLFIEYKFRHDQFLKIISLIADNSIKIILDILFFFLSNRNIGFIEKKLE